MYEQIIAHNIESKKRTKDVTSQENLTFQSLFLSEKVLGGLTSSGYRKPSPIQLNAIPVGRCGFDLIVKSKAGTGKTLVFSVISLEIINTVIHDLQVLILVPTRELAVQIADVIGSIGKNFDNLKVRSFIGGLPEKDDLRKAQKCHIAVGAPGRIKSLIKHNILKVDSLKLFVLDEADKLMENNFQNDVNEIYYKLPSRKQIIATSATYPKELNDFLSYYMQSPTQINVEYETPLLLGLKQYVKIVKPSSNSISEMKHKNEELIKLLQAICFSQCLIFSNYQTRAETVSLMLNRYGWNSTFISSVQSQVKRLEVIDNLKNFKCRILLSTDLTARGIDVANIDLIINYDIPSNVMTYLHRMGRAGRYGSRGLCISLISGIKDIRKIQKFLGIIGGKNQTISKLPDMKERKVDLWDTNMNEFEQLTGIVDEDENEDLSFNIKNKILRLNSNKVGKPEMSFNCPEMFEEIKFYDKVIGESTLQHLNSLFINEKKLLLNKVESENIDDEMSDGKVALESMAKGIFHFKNVSEFESTELIPSKTTSQNMSIRDSLSSRDKERDTCTIDYHTTTLISLAQGKFDFLTYQGSNFNMCCQEPNTEYMDDTKKKMTNSTSVINESNDDCMGKILLKNRALYEVAKVLTDNMEFISSDTAENLNYHFTFLKDQNCFEKYSQICEISNIVTNSDFQLSSSVHDHSLKEVDTSYNKYSFWKDVSSENIFLHAYKLAIKDKKRRLFGGSEIEINEISKNYRIEDEISDWENSVEFNEKLHDFSGLQYNENGKRIYAYENIPNRMVWIPVQKSVFDSNELFQKNLLESDDFTYAENIKDPHLNSIGTTELSAHNESKISTYEYLNLELSSAQSDQRNCTNSINISQTSEGYEQLESYPHKDFYYDHFVTYFDQCSGELWQDGWRFDSVDNFDNWFYQWQQRVQHVTDYIKQNIYVKELSDYQSRKEK